MRWYGWPNQNKIQQKTSIKNANIALSHCPSWFPINNFVPSGSVRLSPKSLSSAETLPYHAGFPKDGSDSKDDDIMKSNMIVETYLFLESLQSIKSWSQIASRGFTTTHSPSSSASASKFVWNTLECLCPQSLTNDQFKAGLMFYSWSLDWIEMDRWEFTLDQWSMVNEHK